MRSGVCFSSDCLGAPMATADLAQAENVRAASPDELRAAQLLWASVDSPWIHNVDTSMFARSVQGIRALNPTWIFSSHLPPATGDMTRLLDTLLEAPSADVFIGPDQAALEAMLRQFEPV
jgi:hypothetical protein